MKEEVSWVPSARNSSIKTLTYKNYSLQEAFYHPTNTEATTAGTAGWEQFVSPAVFEAPSIFAVSAWAAHTPFAAWLMEKTAPAIFVELGTHAGLSYFTFCRAVASHHLATKCFAVDSWQGDMHAGFYNNAVYEQVEQQNRQYNNFSTLYKCTFDEALDRFPEKSVDLLHIDGLHTYEAVKHDFYSWLPKMSERGIVLFHDISVKDRGFGVYRFWEEVKQQFPHFEFVHGYGLGIIGTGSGVPASIHALFALGDTSASANTIRHIYKRLGRLAKLEQAFTRLERKHPGIHAAIDSDAGVALLTGAAAQQYLSHSAGSVSIAPLQELTIQVYWQLAGTAFNEQDSIIKTVNLHQDAVKISCKIPAGTMPVTKLRIDPATAPGIFYLHALSIRQQGQPPLLQLGDLPLHSTFQNLAIVKSVLAEDAFILIALSNDPIIELSAGDTRLQESGINLSIELEMGAMDAETLHKELNALALLSLEPKTVNDSFANIENAADTHQETINPAIITTHQPDFGK